MSRDRFLKFTGSAPSPDEINHLLWQYIGMGGWVERQDHPTLSHWCINLPGFCTGRIDGDEQCLRWIEVFLHPPEDFYDHVRVDVLTRQMDDYTNAVAEGIVVLILRKWSAEREP